MINTTLRERYRIESELGRGGMGIVYRAFDTHLERDAAIKVLQETSAIATKGRSRLLAEARAAAGLDHQNIVTVYDAVELEDISFIVMQYVDGQPLNHYRPQAVEEIMDIVSQLCLALDHAHGQGIIHRDIKPANVLITPSGRAMLMDFGLARSIDKRLTVEGFAGTLDYIAPEQAMGEALDGRTDLYSLGVLFYELLTGQLPFTADDPVSILTQHLHAPVVAPRAKNDAISLPLNQLVIDLMEKDPINRPSSAAEVIRLIELARLPVPLQTEPEEAELGVLDRIARGRMIGRRDELQEARSLWTKAAASEGQTLLISGEPGIGKTRLIRELTTLADVTGGHALVGACYPEGGSPYAPFSQIVRSALGAGPNGHELPGFVLAEMLNLAPELSLAYPDIAPNPPLDPQAGQRRLFDSISLFSQALSKDQPLLLVLEDAHWADDGTLALLRHLARRAQNQRQMIVATYREVELDKNLPFNQVLMDLQRERFTSRLKLTRLDQQATEKMLGELFAEEITPDFLDGIYRETEGNPFFIEEVCKTLVESGELYFDDGQWQRPENMRELSIPQTVRVAIQSRLAVLEQVVRDVLQLAAVIGRDFDFDTLIAAGSWDEDTIIDALEQAEHSQLVEEVSSERGATYSFVHALIPATLVEGLSGLRQRRLHRLIAQVIEQQHPDDLAMLAYHYRLAQDKNKALHYLKAAGHQASDRFSNEDALRFYSQAVDFVKDDKERFDLLLARIKILHLLADRETEWEDVKELTELANDLADERRVITALLAAAEYYLETEAVKARDPAREAADRASALEDVVQEGKALLILGSAFWYGGDYQQSQIELKAALEIFEDADNLDDSIAALHMMSLALGSEGENDRAMEAAKKALELSHRSGSKLAEATSLRRVAIAYEAEREYEEALPYAERALKLHRQLGDRSEEMNALNVLGLINRSMGDSESGHRFLLDSLAVAEEIESNTGIQFAILNHSGGLAGDGKHQESWDFLLLKLEQYKHVSDPGLLGNLHMNLAFSAYMVGNLDRLISELELALSYLEGIHPPSQAGAWTAFIAAAYGELGQLEMTSTKLAEAAELIEPSDDHLAVAFLKAARAHYNYLVNEHLEEAIALIDETIPILKRTSSYAMVIRSLTTKARMLLNMAQAKEASNVMTQILPIMDYSFVVFRPQEVWYTKYLIHESLGEADEALNAFEEAINYYRLIEDNLKDDHLLRCWRENIPDNRLIRGEAESKGIA